VAGRGTGPDFVEALARGLDVLAALGRPGAPLTLAEVATAADLARPTARRLLLTLEELGYVRVSDGAYSLTPRVLQLGMAYVGAQGLWEVARPHLEALVGRTGESSSMAQLDGSDIVYVARVSVPKIIALRVEIGTRFPAGQTSQGKVLLAALPPGEVSGTLARPSQAGLPPYIGRSLDQLLEELAQVRARGWALADEELAPGVRSVAVPVRDGAGAVRAAMNVTVHAAETSVDTLLDDHLPHLLRAAGEVSADWALWQSRPHAEVTRAAGQAASGAD
jgi:IclR family pca regulon transcriptional regulator